MKIQITPIVGPDAPDFAVALTAAYRKWAECGGYSATVLSDGIETDAPPERFRLEPGHHRWVGTSKYFDGKRATCFVQVQVEGLPDRTITVRTYHIDPEAWTTDHTINVRVPDLAVLDGDFSAFYQDGKVRTGVKAGAIVPLACNGSWPVDT